MPPRKRSPWDKVIPGVLKLPPPRDPCGCDEVCDHGERCLGGHANYPESHWYPCDDCTPKRDGLGMAICLCSHQEWRHTPKCRSAACGCTVFRPKVTGGDDAA